MIGYEILISRGVSMEISPGAYAKVEGFDRERNLLTVERPGGEKLTYDPRPLQGVTVIARASGVQRGLTACSLRPWTKC
jgi:hypothetical protein